MSNLMEFIKALFPVWQSQRDLDEAYLAESTDVYDLERRMRDLDSDSRQNGKHLTFGIVSP
jgi:hypothetical protein